MTVKKGVKPPIKKAAKKELTPTERLNKIGIESICAYVAAGDSMRSWAISNGFATTTVHDWIEADAVRAEHYARAREARAEAVFEMLDDVSEQAAKAETAVEVAGLRLKSDNIKWKLARMNAKKYGDRLEHVGEGGGAIKHDMSIAVSFVAPTK